MLPLNQLKSRRKKYLYITIIVIYYNCAYINLGVTCVVKQHTIGFCIAKICKLKRHLVDIEMKKLGICRSKWQTLIWLHILGPCSQQDLLKRLEIDAAHLARVLDAFEREQWIVRTRSHHDRRALFIEITLLCQHNIMPKIESILKKENNLMLKGLTTEEKITLTRLLKTIENNLLTLSEAEAETNNE